MKRGSAVLLQAVVAFVGIGALAFLLGEPHLEGRNRHATLFEIYFKDLFLAFAYVASIPFFVALYKVFRVLGYAGKDQALSHATVSDLRTIKLCALAVLAFVAASVVFMPFADPDDTPPGVVMRVFAAFVAVVAAAAAAMFERIFRNAVAIKSENDLTV
jgi:hypothetical protein